MSHTEESAGDSQAQIQDVLTRNLNIEVAAREPWPLNTSLYVPLKEQMPIWAPTCLASLCLLRQVQIPSLNIHHVRNAAEMSIEAVPPVLTLNNRVLCAFDEIASLIELKGLLPNDFTTNSMVESYSILATHTLGSLMKYVLFNEKAGPTVYQSFTSVYPWPLGFVLYIIHRNETVKFLKVQDMWSLSYDQVIAKFEDIVRALSEKLQQNQSQYLFGNKFSKADAHLYGHLFTILQLNIPEYENLRNILLHYQPLVDYVNQMEKDVRGLSILVD